MEFLKGKIKESLKTRNSEKECFENQGILVIKEYFKKQGILKTGNFMKIKFF